MISILRDVNRHVNYSLLYSLAVTIIHIREKRSMKTSRIPYLSYTNVINVTFRI